jgi:hypothetical protein
MLPFFCRAAPPRLHPPCPRHSTRLRLVVLPLLLLPLVGADHAQSKPDPKPIIRGILRYERRGVSAAPPTGLVTGVFVGAAAGVGSQRAVKGFFKAMSGAAALSGKSSTKDIHDLLRSTDNLDMSGWPVKAEYGADVSFTLEEGKDGVFQLKEGSVSWSTRNDTKIVLEGKDGNTHIFHDVARGQGSSALTPENSSITLRTEGKGKDATVTLDIDVKHTMPYDANALWSAMGGLSVLRIEEHAGTQQWHMNVLGQQYDEPPKSGEPSSGGFGYSRTTVLDSISRGREVWLNMYDSPERIEYQLFADCTAEIKRPIENDELAFDDKRPGKIEQYAKSEVIPDTWASAVRWVFPEIKGSKLEPAPEKAKGDSVPYTYTGLPDQNADFKFGDFVTDFDSKQATAAGCKGEKRPAAFFFSREANNNPGKPALPPGSSRSTPDPNWFYYWLQTKAAQGHAAQIRYSDGSDMARGELRCQPGGDYGVYLPETDYITVCNLAKVGFASRSYPGLGPVRNFHGIDVFGVTIRHEWQHFLDYRQWWGNPYGRYIDAFDKDGDKLPDKLEDSIVPPSPLNKRVAHFNPLVFDSALEGLGDEHTFAWAAEHEYPVGTADAEDWSCEGGHQAFSDKCKEVYQVKIGPPVKEVGPNQKVPE